jgi:hypothetical protein
MRYLKRAQNIYNDHISLEKYLTTPILFCINEKKRSRRLVDESQDLSSGVLPPGLLVVHDSGRGGKDDLSERTGREQQVDPVLDCQIEMH